jgi:hypothetical protein
MLTWVLVLLFLALLTDWIYKNWCTRAK